MPDSKKVESLSRYFKTNITCQVNLIQEKFERLHQSLLEKRSLSEKEKNLIRIVEGEIAALKLFLEGF